MLEVAAKAVAKIIANVTDGLSAVFLPAPLLPQRPTHLVGAYEIPSHYTDNFELGQTRLLATADRVGHCYNLVTVDLNTKPVYVALFYVWGTEIAIKKIEVTSKTFLSRLSLRRPSLSPLKASALLIRLMPYATIKRPPQKTRKEHAGPSDDQYPRECDQSLFMVRPSL